MELKGELKLKLLRDFFKVTQGITDEVLITVSKDGLSTTVVDPTHAAMADVLLKAAAFEEYVSKDGEFAIDINKVVNFIGLGKKDDIIRIGIIDNSLSITIGCLNKKIRLLDTMNIPNPKLAEISYDCHVTLKRDDFANGAKAGGVSHRPSRYH